MKAVKVFAPGTVANLGPGFDVLGIAVTGCGDTVLAERTANKGVVIDSIVGDGGRLPRSAAKNTAGIAAQQALELVGADGGVRLKLEKGLPLGSGLGSSAASAAAAIWAVALLYGAADWQTQHSHRAAKLPLLPAGLAAEAAVSGFHADNIAPALLGGLILVQSCQPLRVHPIPVPDDFTMVLVTPEYELQTSTGRKALPEMVSLRQMVANTGNLATLISAGFQNDTPTFGRAVVDAIVEPVRGGLIPGFEAVKQAALQAGAFGCSIGGSGPTVFAIANSTVNSQALAQAMQAAFAQVALPSVVNIAQVDGLGARQID